MVTALLAGLAAFCLLMIFILFSIGAQAHEWFTGARNPVTNEGCCNSVDCRVIGYEDWWTEKGAVFVKWSDGRIYSMPAGQALPTQDPQGKPAACVLAGRLRCFFMPLSF